MSNNSDKKLKRNSVGSKKNYYINDDSYKQDYIEEGSALRYTDYPQKKKNTKRYPKKSIRERNVEVRKNRARAALGIDLPFLILLTVALGFTLNMCYSYLRVRAGITASIRNIELKEKELAAFQNQNDTIEMNIKSSIDLDHIYDVATKELGMVYAKKDQIIKYNTSEKEYVRQYEDIPDR